jgi:hypothetical protein
MAPIGLLEMLKLDFKTDCEDTDIRIIGVTGKEIHEETHTLKLWIQNPTTKVGQQRWSTFQLARR